MALDTQLTVKQSIAIETDACKVWDALTNPDKVRMYFFGTTLLTDWRIGSPIIFQGQYEGQQYKDGGTILAIDPLRLLQYSYWSGFSGLEDTAENYSIITYLLGDTAGGCTLTVMQEGFASVQNRDHAERNWAMVLEKIRDIACAGEA